MSGCFPLRFSPWSVKDVSYSTAHILLFFGEGIDEIEAVQLLPDPQTNGGLLIAVAPSDVTTVQAILKEFDIAYTTPFGEVGKAKEKRIIVNKE